MATWTLGMDRLKPFRISRQDMKWFTTVLAVAMFAVISIPLPTIQAQTDDVHITEILVSPNNEDYGGNDWNGDGTIGAESDQFIEIFNPTDVEMDLSGWVIEHTNNKGAKNCTLSSQTIIQPQEYLVLYRSETLIEFNFFDGDTVHLFNSQGNLIDTVSYPSDDSDWDTPYGINQAGEWSKLANITPTPGGPNHQSWVGVNHQHGSCERSIDHIQDESYILSGKIVTMLEQDEIIENGHLLIEDGIITAIWSTQDPTPEQALTIPESMWINTNGVIYPGLIDAHNHAHYNFIPLWDHGGDGWSNRYQWQGDSGYKSAVSTVKGRVTGGSSTQCDLNAEGMKFAEVRSLAGGATSIQGSSTSDRSSFDSILARNVEYYNFGRDNVHTKVTEIESDYEGNHIKSGNASGNLNAWYLHLAEGIDESSRQEFDVLVQNGLLVGELVVIHGTGLTETEFNALGAVGADLVWSPISNLLLYGETTNVAAAKQAGMNIALAPDWSPSGAKNPLHELKVADWWNKNELNSLFSNYELVEMVTTNPAASANWLMETGSLQVGLAADILVLEEVHQDPYRNLIEAIDPDVKLVIVAGLPVFGDELLFSQLDNEYEILQAPGYQKVVDVTYETISGAHKEMNQIIQEISDCMATVTATPMEKWYTYGDQRYFSVLNGSNTFQKNRNIDLWSDYYDISLDENGKRTGLSNTTSTSGDMDGDGWTNTVEILCGTDQNDSDSIPEDLDGDGKCDALDDDVDGDGYANDVDAFPQDDSAAFDTDFDGLPDQLIHENGSLFEDIDDDGDGWADDVESICQTDPMSNKSVPTDRDGDQICDGIDLFPDDSTEWEDLDGDGFGDNNGSKSSDDTTIQLSSNDDSITGNPLFWVAGIIMLVSTIMLTMLILSYREK